MTTDILDYKYKEINNMMLIMMIIISIYTI